MHILAGYLQVSARTAIVNIEHPPLMKELAGLAVSALPVPAPPSTIPMGTSFTTWGHTFLFDGPVSPDAIAAAARAPFLAVFAALLALVFFAARARWGSGAALFAVALVAFDPNLGAHAGVVHTDLGAALAFLAAVLAWDAAQRRPTPARVVAAGARDRARASDEVLVRLSAADPPAPEPGSLAPHRFGIRGPGVRSPGGSGRRRRGGGARGPDRPLRDRDLADGPRVSAPGDPRDGRGAGRTRPLARHRGDRADLSAPRPLPGRARVRLPPERGRRRRELPFRDARPCTDSRPTSSSRFSRRVRSRFSPRRSSCSRRSCAIRRLAARRRSSAASRRALPRVDGRELQHRNPPPSPRLSVSRAGGGGRAVPCAPRRHRPRRLATSPARLAGAGLRGRHAPASLAPPHSSSCCRFSRPASC